MGEELTDGGRQGARGATEDGGGTGGSEQVQLVFQLEKAEARDIHARYAESGAYRTLRLVFTALIALLMSLTMVPLVLGRTTSYEYAVEAVILSALFGLVMLRTRARLVRLWVEQFQETRLVLDDSAITMTNKQATTVREWRSLEGYIETPLLFLLKTERIGKQLRWVVVPLSKRALGTPHEVDRCRTVLDRHLTRI